MIYTKQIFDEMSDIFAHLSISMPTVFGGLRFLKLGKCLPKMTSALVDLEPILHKVNITAVTAVVELDA